MGTVPGFGTRSDYKQILWPFFNPGDWDDKNAKMLCSLFANNTVLGTTFEEKRKTKQNMSLNTKA